MRAAEDFFYRCGLDSFGYCVCVSTQEGRTGVDFCDHFIIIDSRLGFHVPDRVTS